jgi:uncharacterized delta-60 repeat protein
MQMQKYYVRNFLFISVFILAGLLAACNPYGATPATENPQPVARFSLKPVSDSLELPAGGETSLIVNLERGEGFTGIVDMSFEGLPEGIEQVWSRDTDNGDCTVKLIAHSEIPEGEYTLTLRGVTESGNVSLQAENTMSQNVSLRVTGGSFSLSLQPAILPMPQGSVTITKFNIVRKGFAEGGVLKFLDVPAGILIDCVTCFERFGSENIDGDETSHDLRLEVTSGATLGNKTITLEVTLGSAVRKLQLQVNVQAAPAEPTFKLIAPSLSVTAPFDTPVSMRVSIVRVKGFDKQILFKIATPGFSATDTLVAADQPDVVLNVLRTRDTALTLPATQPFTITGQAVGANITQNLNVEFIIRPVSGDRDFSFSSSVTAGAGSADHGLILLPDGKVVVGSTANGSFILKRLNADGSSDPTFASRFETAQVKIGFQGVAELRALALAPDGDVIAVGTVTQNEPNFTSKIAVAKVNPDGSLDAAFDKKTLAIGSIAEGRAVTVTSGGQILIAGQASGQTVTADSLQAQATIAVSCGVVALRANGSFDSSFSGDGLATFSSNDGIGLTSDTCNTIALALNNLIVVGGVSQRGDDNRFLVARLQTSGELDKNFDGDGIVITDVRDLTDVVNNVVVQPNGKIIAGGFGVDGSSEFGILARYNTNGSLDSSFDGDGIRATPAHALSGGAFFERGIRGLALQTSGDILLIEDKDGTPVLRYLKANGSTFDLTRSDLFNTNLSDIKLDTNKKIMLLGIGVERRFP